MLIDTYKKYQKEVVQHVNTIEGNVPAHRNASKYLYSFSSKSFAKQLAIWNYIWRNTENFQVRTHAFFFLERNMKKNTTLQQMWPVVVNWQDHVNDWGLCDALAKIYTKILVVIPHELYEHLKKWNGAITCGSGGNPLFRCYIIVAQKKITYRLIKSKS